MRQIFAFVMAAIAVCPIVLMAFAASRTEDEATPIFGIKMPPGYRDWRLISVAHEEGDLNDLIPQRHIGKQGRERRAKVPGASRAGRGRRSIPI
jgi:hypothetical protein